MHSIMRQKATVSRSVLPNGDSRTSPTRGRGLTMAGILMDRIDRALKTMDLHDLAELYCRSHDREREADEPIPRIFYRIMRRHIALAVQTKLEREEYDGGQVL